MCMCLLKNIKTPRFTEKHRYTANTSPVGVGQGARASITRDLLVLVPGPWPASGQVAGLKLKTISKI